MTSNGTGTRRELNRQATHQAIVDAALRLLREGHGTAITATQIAEIAGISRRTLFNYFPSVDAILSYPLHAVLEHMVETLTPLTDQLPLMQAVVRALESERATELLGQVAQFGAYLRRQENGTCYPPNFIAWQSATGDVIAKIAARYPHTDAYSIRVFTHAILGAGQAAFDTWIDQLPEPDATGLHVSDELISSFHRLITRAMETLDAGFNSLPLTAPNSLKED
ncbi:hypothetical protein CQ017_11485 [Arthrobacter sp. MYb224]|uniref:TetR family transcriptional regulator n=1 Tax=Micrococcaceae TaxID=1268 RepID=UPI000BB6B57D|nr:MULTISPECIES: TetR family transcriptional regulator [Micrococcaceae]PCC28004.1 hypothetical protein CIK76_14160 [Glutamicibacter sp. BW80]PQZ98231.1 hypothetical protein CQ017_11485 [Arthrobacter sp. MYb224]PRA02363.1 hypothetical protein CQ019_12905 [Arthrobacter sp. MYb229]PRB50694.1 hypothetical protein CQ013_11920 [Arthrobacter sp. MYb216]